MSNPASRKTEVSSRASQYKTMTFRFCTRCHFLFGQRLLGKPLHLVHDDARRFLPVTNVAFGKVTLVRHSLVFFPPMPRGVAALIREVFVLPDDAVKEADLGERSLGGEPSGVVVAGVVVGSFVLGKVVDALFVD